MALFFLPYETVISLWATVSAQYCIFGIYLPSTCYMLNTWWKPTACENLNHCHIISLLKVIQWLLLLVEKFWCLTSWLMRFHILKMFYPILLPLPFWLYSAKLVFLLPQTCQAYSSPWAFAHALSSARNIPPCMLIFWNCLHDETTTQKSPPPHFGQKFVSTITYINSCHCLVSYGPAYYMESPLHTVI